MQLGVLAGLIVNSAAYLLAVFVAGLMWGDKPAVCLSIAAMGVTYLSYFWTLAAGRKEEIALAIGIILVALSILIGASAGIALLMGVL